MLKLLAAFFMLLDHIGYYLQPVLSENLYFLLRAIGRLAFPIFAYSVARGYSRTRNPSRYFLRLITFAVISELIIRSGYALAGLKMHWTNVLFTFALSIAVVAGYRLICHCGRDLIASLQPIPAGPSGLKPPARYDVRVNIFGIELDARIGTILGTILIMSAMVTATLIKCDYDIYGLLTVLFFFMALDHPDTQVHVRYSTILLSVLNLLFFILKLVDGASFPFALLQTLSLLSLPIIFHFHGKSEKRPGFVRKYAFYLFYPTHIFILLLIRSAL